MNGATLHHRYAMGHKRVAKIDVNKLDNSEEMDKFLETYNFSRLIHDANQNHNEVPFHASQNGCYPEVHKQ